MTNNEAAELLFFKNKPLNINQAIDLIEIKIQWCKDVMEKNLDNFYISQRTCIERTTLSEALDIIKRVKKYPHDPYSKECN
jgi:hypothetical protein